MFLSQKYSIQCGHMKSLSDGFPLSVECEQGNIPSRVGVCVVDLLQNHYSELSVNQTQDVIDSGK